MGKIVLFVMAACIAFSALSCRGDDDTVFRIGAIFPLSGPQAFFGRESLDGGLLAMEEINANGGLLGRQLILLYEDDENRPELTINAFSRLATRERVNIIFGFTRTSFPFPSDKSR